MRGGIHHILYLRGLCALEKIHGETCHTVRQHSHRIGRYETAVQEHDERRDIRDGGDRTLMEFTLSRVVMGMCGLLVLAAVLSPLSAVYENKEDSGLQSQCDAVARMIDAFSGSEMSHMELSGSDIIPHDCTLTFDGNVITLTYDDREYLSYTVCTLVSDGTYTSDDTIGFLKDSDTVTVTRT